MSPWKIKDIFPIKTLSTGCVGKPRPNFTTNPVNIFMVNLLDMDINAYEGVMVHKEHKNNICHKWFQNCNFIVLAFGFCEYEQPEATLRCIRLLNEWIIADKKLVASVFCDFLITRFISVTFER